MAKTFTTFELPKTHPDYEAIMLLQAARNLQYSDQVAVFLGDAILYLWNRDVQ